MYRYFIIACLCIGMLSVSCGTQGGRADTPPATNMTQSTTSAPQKDGPCDSADAHANINGAEATCKQNSAGELSWQVQTNADQPNQEMTLNGPCTTPDQHANIAGQEVLCQKDQQGNLAWLPAAP